MSATEKLILKLCVIGAMITIAVVVCIDAPIIASRERVCTDHGMGVSSNFRRVECVDAAGQLFDPAFLK